MYDIIEKKRNGEVLSKEQIAYFIREYTADNIPDYQVSALLMAIYFQGMSIEESAHLTMAMVESGETVDLSMIEGIKVDKHSTGGVGDTTTLILAPLVASCGVSVAKMSGRGLGHTGGTIDKLESFDGFHTELSNEEFIRLVREDHLAVIGQSENIVPADKLLYSLRDVTATVDSIPLIASSIMSKKIAAGADAIVLDVKTGAGAFMKDLKEARLLAETMVKIGEEVGRKTTAIISNMEQPLGYAVGNALEVKEAIATLKGEGPEDLTELVIELGALMVLLAGGAADINEATELLHTNITNGKAIQTFKTFIQHQGGDPSQIDQPSLLPSSAYNYDIEAEKEGYIQSITANEIGRAAMLLGAGRETKQSAIDLGVGVMLRKKIGDKVTVGETICTVYSNKPDPNLVVQMIKNNIKIGEQAAAIPLIFDRLS